MWLNTRRVCVCVPHCVAYTSKLIGLLNHTQTHTLISQISIVTMFFIFWLLIVVWGIKITSWIDWKSCICLFFLFFFLPVCSSFFFFFIVFTSFFSLFFLWSLGKRLSVQQNKHTQVDFVLFFFFTFNSFGFFHTVLLVLFAQTPFSFKRSFFFKRIFGDLLSLSLSRSLLCTWCIVCKQPKMSTSSVTFIVLEVLEGGSWLAVSVCLCLLTHFGLFGKQSLVTRPMEKSHNCKNSQQGPN